MKLEGRQYRPRYRTRIVFLIFPRRCDVDEPDPSSGERCTEWRWMEVARYLEERVQEDVHVGGTFVGRAESWRLVSLAALKDLEGQL